MNNMVIINNICELAILIENGRRYIINPTTKEKFFLDTFTIEDMEREGIYSIKIGIVHFTKKGEN